MWFMSLFTSLPPNTSWFYEQTSVESWMQLKDCSKDTVLEQAIFSAPWLFLHKMQFLILSKCAPREPLTSVVMMGILELSVQGLWLWMHTLCRACVTADFVAPLSELWCLHRASWACWEMH